MDKCCLLKKKKSESVHSVARNIQGGTTKKGNGDGEMPGFNKKYKGIQIPIYLIQ